MKILAFSDLHRDVVAAQSVVDESVEADLVIGAGDFATKGLGASETIAILRQIKTPVIFVAGNHDSLDELRLLCSGWELCHVLHGQSAVVDGRTFFGLGFEVAEASRATWNSHLTEAAAEIALFALPPRSVLISHHPPHGIADLQANGVHDGSHAIRDAIGRQQPLLNLCGHIHNAWQTSGEIGRCGVHNLGPRPTLFNL